MLVESASWVRLAELSPGPVTPCSPDDDLVSVAAALERSTTSSLVVCDREQALGIITDRDLRRAIVETGGALEEVRARDIMSAPLVTVRQQEHVFEAIYKMSRHNVHRLVVVDEADRPSGVVTDTDLVALQTKTPLYLGREIESANSLATLKRINHDLLEAVSLASSGGAGARNIVRLISHFNDALTRRIIALLELREGIRCPRGAAYLVLGSEGRRDQTLRTDQDSAMVFADDLPPDEVRSLEGFSGRLVEALVEIGVPRCPGETMASNPAWRRSLAEWMRLLDQWITVPTPEHMVNFGMFQDLRTVWGDESLERRLKEHLLQSVARNSLFLASVARNIVRFSPPLSLFGKLRTERSGDHKGLLDLKKAGLFAITEGVSLLALEARILDGSTWEKIEALRDLGVVPRDELARLDEAFTFLVGLRLKFQLEAVAGGKQPSKWIDPVQLATLETEHLKDALATVATFLRTVREHFQLDLIPR